MTEKENIVRDFYVAGARFHELPKVIHDLSIGNTLKLVPEPTNPYDPNAIKIIYETFEKSAFLGYVPAKFSSEISALMEISKLECEITELNPSAKPWEMCKVAIKKKED